jgi:hypothetical protein
MASAMSLVSATEAVSRSLLKTDKLCRLRRSSQQRVRIPDEFERSGLTRPKFAVLCGVKDLTLASLQLGATVWKVPRTGSLESLPYAR